MNLIKFRQYNSVHRYWHYWGNFKNPGIFIFPNNNESFSESLLFTGAKDINDKDIFEGDIVHYYIDLNTIGLVYWAVGECGFSINWINEGRCQFNNFTWKSYEIIGNKFENPELLNKE